MNESKKLDFLYFILVLQCMFFPKSRPNNSLNITANQSLCTCRLASWLSSIDMIDLNIVKKQVFGKGGFEFASNTGCEKKF